MHLIKSAKYAGEFRVLLRFEDGCQKVVDLSPYLDGEVFEPLKDKAYFASFSLNAEPQTIVWENGDDFSPDFLYEVGAAAGNATKVG